MARLTPYIDNASPSVPQPFNVQPQTQVGQALSNLGSSVVGFADKMASDQKQQANKAEAEAKQDYYLRIQSDAMDMQTQLVTQLDNGKENMPAGGFGFTENIQKTAQQETERRLSSYNATSDPKASLIYQHAAEGVIRQAQSIESTTRIQWRAQVSGEKMDELTKLVGANPENFGPTKQLWQSFVEQNVSAGENGKRDLLDTGFRKLEQAHLQAWAAANPDKFMSAFNGSVQGMPISADVPTHIQQSIAGAVKTNYDPKSLLGIANIEAPGLNPNEGNPRRKDGTPMSSADGMFQVLQGVGKSGTNSTLSELGLRPDETRDYSKVAPALSAYLVRQQNWMQSNSIQTSPGKEYMTWNMGPGLAHSVLQADPNTPIQNVVRQVYANRSPEFVAQVLHNNPGLYKPGMTVGQVVQNYENKMTASINQVQGYVTGQTIPTEEQAKSIYGAILPAGSYDRLNMRDAADVFTQIAKNSKQATAKDMLQSQGQGVLSGDIPARPFDDNTKKAVNSVLEGSPISQKIVVGDVNAHTQARNIIDRAQFIPDDLVNGYRASMMGADITSKIKTYASLADLAETNKVAYAASKMPDDMRKRIDEYQANVGVLNLPPDVAIKRVDQMHSTDDKMEHKGLKAITAEETKQMKADGYSQAWTAVRKAFDEHPYLPFTRPTPTNDQQQANAVEAYVTAYQFHREDGKNKEDASALAINDLKKSYGVTSGYRGGQSFMAYPPEKVLPQIGGSSDWVKAQAENFTTNVLVGEKRIRDEHMTTQFDNNPTMTGATEYFRHNYDMRLIPDAQTASEVRSGKSPSYMIDVRNPDGTVERIPYRFRPDIDQAMTENRNKFQDQNQMVRDNSAGIEQFNARVVQRFNGQK